MTITIFDIDGVLADVTHLLPLIEGDNKDYEAYYTRIGEAKFLKLGVNNLKKLGLADRFYTTYFLTGRSECSRSATLKWLGKIGHKGLIWVSALNNLLMRADGDHRPAHCVKKEMVQKIHERTGVPYSEMTVFEDDDDCVNMYRKLGCYVCHVKHEKARSK